MALAMVEGAERDGLLSPGDTVVEYTGGSTGPALALVCRAKGYRALIVIADCFTEERFQLMRALGAELDVVPSVKGRPIVTAQDIQTMVARAGELARQPGHYATDQFNNPYIIPGHRDQLGREIWEQSEGRVTAFCQGIGTGSSLIGVSDALRPRGVVIQGHEPTGSAAIGGGERGSFAIQGWTGVVPPHWDADRVDLLEAIPDDEAMAMTTAARRRGGSLRRYLDRGERRRGAPPRRAPRAGCRDRDDRGRHRVQVHERRAVRVAPVTPVNPPASRRRPPCARCAGRSARRRRPGPSAPPSPRGCPCRRAGSRRCRRRAASRRPGRAAAAPASR